MKNSDKAEGCLIPKERPRSDNRIFAVATVLKIEVAMIFLFTADLSIERAFGVAIIWAVINQITEAFYSQCTHFNKKLITLFVSILPSLFIYLMVMTFSIQFTYQSHGQTKFDHAKIWALALLTLVVAGITGILRLAACAADFILNRYHRLHTPN
jgi:hypothetical protein